VAESGSPEPSALVVADLPAALDALAALLTRGVATEELRSELAPLLRPLGDLVASSLPADEAEQYELGEKERAARQLEWVGLVRTRLLAPLEEATIKERNLAVQRAMTAGVPASALVTSTGLTLARIYQIRDGRR